MANTASFILRLQDKFSAASARINAATKKMRRNFRKLTIKTIRLQRNLAKLGKKSKEVGKEILGAMVIPLAAMGLAVKISSDMEDAMSDVGRVVTATGDQLTAFENKLETMSEHLGKNKVGLAQMAFEGGKLGIALKDMEPFLDLVTKTAIAFDLEDQEAGRAIGSIRAKMGLMNDDVKVLLDSVNFLADNTSASGARMINVIERISGTMKLLNVPPEATAALAGFADQLEVTSELAASGLRMFITKMKQVPGNTTKLMTDPIGTVRKELEKIAKMGPELRTRFIEKAFGAEAGRFVEKMVANVDLFGKTVDTAFSTKAIGSMQRELENQLKRSSISFKRFRQTGTNTMDSIGDAIKPLVVSFAKLITPVIDVIGRFAKAFPKIFQFIAVVTVLTAVLGLLMVVFGAVALAIGLISAPVLIVAAAIAALGAVIVFWDDLKIAVIKSINTIIDVINLAWAPINALIGLLGFDGIKIPKIDLPEQKIPVSIDLDDPKLSALVASIPVSINVDDPKLSALKAPLTIDTSKLEQLVASIPVDLVNTVTVEAPSAPIAPSGSINGEITVSASPGSKIEKTKMQSRGPGLNVGMNVAEAI